MKIDLVYSLAVVAACLIVRERTDCTVAAYCCIESIIKSGVAKCIMT